MSSAARKQNTTGKRNLSSGCAVIARIFMRNSESIEPSKDEFRTIEIWINGEGWKVYEFENLVPGMIFRFTDDPFWLLMCTERPYPLPDVPGNFGVQAEPLNGGKTI